MEEKKYIIEHSEEIDDIISTPPSWMVRSGTITIFIILTSLILLAAFIRYPDVITTELRIINRNLPKSVNARVNGKIVKILVKDGTMVKQGQILAYMESTAEHQDVLLLEQWLSKIKRSIDQPSEINSNVQILNSSALKLGELQAVYVPFYEAYLNYSLTKKEGFNYKKKQLFTSDLGRIQKQKDYLLKQRDIQQKNTELALEEYRMHQDLTMKKVEAPMELKRQENIYLEKTASIFTIDNQLAQLDKEKNGKNNELLALANSDSEAKLKYEQALNNLVSEVMHWKSQYMLISPQDGQIVYSRSIQENVGVKPDQLVFSINTGNKDFLGEIILPQYKLGKIKQGQRVLIKLRSFPYEEFGMLEGNLQTIAEIPDADSLFIARVPLNTTNMRKLRKPIRLKVGMHADAEIITQDASLLTRVFESLLRIKDI